MKDIQPVRYEDIDTEALEQVLKEQGMVFVELPAHHGRAYLKFLERALRIEHGERFRAGRVRRVLWLAQAILALPNVVLRHSKLLDLDGFRVITGVRCTHEQQANGTYVFIYS